MPRILSFGNYSSDNKQNFFVNIFNSLRYIWQSLDKFSKFSVITLLLIFFIGIGSAGMILQLNTHASGTTVTISNTAAGTTQTQLSTNLVTWGADFTQIPNGAAEFNTLNLPLVRLHVGDDGGPAMPEINYGSWDMTTLNTMINDVYASGQQPMVNIKFAPDWMWTCYPNSIGVNNSQGTGTVKDLTFQTFAQYMARLVSYYNKGSLTEENGTILTNPNGISHRVTYWELWNEPDLNNETPCAPSTGFGITYTQYTTMWNAVTSAMLAVDPTLKFIGPATAGSQFGSSNTTGNQYIDYLMANGTVKPYAISFHGYGYWANGVPDKYFFDGDGTQGGGGITDMISGVKSIHQYYPSYPVWLTEVNVNADWGAAGQNDDELGAAWWGAMMQNLAPLNVGVIHQFDFSGSNLFGLIDGEGINNNQPTGTPMLPYYVVQLLNNAFPPGSTLLNSTSAQSGILSLAAKKPDGTISVLIVNRQLASNTVQSKCGSGGVAATVTVDISALYPTGVTLTQIDKNNVNCSTWYGVAPTSQSLSFISPVTLTFPGYGIAILNITSAGSIVSPTPTPALTSAPNTPTPTPAPISSPTPTPLATPTPISPTPTVGASGSVSFIGSNKASGNFGGGIKVLIPNIQAGNLLIAVAGTNGSKTTWTTPAGWNPGVNSGTSGTQGLNWWWKVATGSESGTYVTLKAGSYEDGGAVVLAYSGTSISSPIVAVGSRIMSNNSGVGNVTSVPFGSVSWSGLANVVSLLLMSWQPNGTTTYWPANYAQLANASDGFAYVRVGANLLSQTTSSLPSQTIKLSTAEDVVQSLQIAVRAGQ